MIRCITNTLFLQCWLGILQGSSTTLFFPTFKLYSFSHLVRLFTIGTMLNVIVCVFVEVCGPGSPLRTGCSPQSCC